ncbi:serine/threonine-protein kinase pim-2-like [Simochromis diagramma]|uniref:serine/threonine-protein kinase pim-2-like n=1 Tax=Simochromis diagramma TaxID=43689 RepID=UPI001A7EDAC9|nr:serine/threonine-protein kinase pim-2-like [Simochromis diagramma]
MTALRVLILVQERPVPAVDLFEYIRENGGCLPEEKAKVILKQLVDAAKDLEEKHIFHRDIKSDNILIETGSDVPRVRIIDFGLSCFATERSRFRFFYGTPIHSPPECYWGKKYRPGPTTVWQMGVVLYEALHVGDFNIMTFIENELKFNEHLSPHCRNFLDACLTDVPEKRMHKMQHKNSRAWFYSRVKRARLMRVSGVLAFWRRKSASEFSREPQSRVIALFH